MSLTYETLDVFTDTRFGGNPLAVVFGAEGLDDDDLQAVAREFNYSETTFVLPPENPDHAARVRIFTPGTELPFAGHPNVGTATVLARRGTVFGKPVGDTLTFEERVGPVRLDILRERGDAVGAVLAAPADPVVERMLEPVALAGAVGLPVAAVVARTHAPAMVSVGPHFLIAELTDLDALAAARSDAGLIADHIGPLSPPEIYLYAVTDEAPGTLAVRARMFAPGMGIAEDPATGAAAVAFAGLLATLTHGDLEIAIDQGVEMGRPSRIDARIDRSGGGPMITIAGRCVPVMRGEMEV
jgi:trans-2,3-dihydro-3-hydroxyanthranilate isomerase